MKERHNDLYVFFVEIETFFFHHIIQIFWRKMEKNYFISKTAERVVDQLTIFPMFVGLNPSAADTTAANITKLFAMVIYCNSLVLQSFCIIKQYYINNYHRMAIKYNCKSFITLPMMANLNTAV